MRSLNGKVAVVTGAARGLGQAFAQRLAQDGAHIAAVDRDDATETVRVVENVGKKAIAIRCDISSPTQVVDLERKVSEAFGRCDILVNNAAIFPRRDFEDISYEEWRAVMAVNLDGPFLVSKVFLPRMRARKWGRIINIASNTMNMVILSRASYITSKAGLVGLTRALASEYGPYGITVNAISPSRTRTPGSTMNQDLVGGMSAEERFRAVARMQAIPFVQEPADLVGTISFLASDDSAFITGQLLNVDGGLARP